MQIDCTSLQLPLAIFNWQFSLAAITFTSASDFASSHEAMLFASVKPPLTIFVFSITHWLMQLYFDFSLEALLQTWHYIDWWFSFGSVFSPLLFCGSVKFLLPWHHFLLNFPLLSVSPALLKLFLNNLTDFFVSTQSLCTNYEHTQLYNVAS